MACTSEYAVAALTSCWTIFGAAGEPERSSNEDRSGQVPLSSSRSDLRKQFLARVKELASSVTILNCLMMLLTLTALYCLESPPEAPMQPSQPRLLQNDLRQDSYVNFSVAVPMNSIIIGAYVTIKLGRGSILAAAYLQMSRPHLLHNHLGHTS